MHSTTMRQVGGSVMLAVPPALLDVIGVRAGSTVDLDVDGGRLVVVPRRRPAYTLDELIAQCDPTAPDDDRAWIDGTPVGREEL
ncbi:AbrB/MazE/SpoVT family DNA-binding domain-containing protein [Candidatus Poriferisodalis sp.]|uniref:AbrB/MazE/SpoVT family DNA-binding domain-containing protein n=1 Tax=Candidatus Poriferisodalis sp. TaxID=3101277 RepID=UPI003B021D36